MPSSTMKVALTALLISVISQVHCQAAVVELEHVEGDASLFPGVQNAVSAVHASEQSADARLNGPRGSTEETGVDNAGAFMDPRSSSADSYGKDDYGVDSVEFRKLRGRGRTRRGGKSSTGKSNTGKSGRGKSGTGKSGADKSGAGKSGAGKSGAGKAASKSTSKSSGKGGGGKQPKSSGGE
jgi:uncharacterized low-complexity protein